MNYETVPRDLNVSVPSVVILYSPSYFGTGNNPFSFQSGHWIKHFPVGDNPCYFVSTISNIEPGWELNNHLGKLYSVSIL